MHGVGIEYQDMAGGQVNQLIAHLEMQVSCERLNGDATGRTMLLDSPAFSQRGHDDAEIRFLDERLGSMCAIPPALLPVEEFHFRSKIEEKDCARRLAHWLLGVVVCLLDSVRR